MRHPANVISSLRLVAAPFLLILAWEGERGAFLIGFAMALVSDMVDGMLARRRHERTVWGAKLDSWADAATYAVLPFAAWWLWSDLVRREAPFVAVAVASYVLPTLMGLLKYGRLTSYHTRGAKLSATLMAPGILLLLAFGIAWPFRLATAVFTLAAIEEITITLLLREWHADIPSVHHALRLAARRK